MRRTLLILLSFVITASTQPVFAQCQATWNVLTGTTTVASPTGCTEVVTGSTTSNVLFHVQSSSGPKIRFDKSGGPNLWDLSTDGSNFYITDTNNSRSPIIAYNSGVVALVPTGQGYATVGTSGGNSPLWVYGDGNASGNIGINSATLEPWQFGKAFQGTTGAFFSGTVGDIHVISNAYTALGATGWKYMNAGVASNFYMYLGDTVFRTAVSGTKDADLSWSERMRIDKNGNVTVGSASNSGTLNVYGMATANNLEIGTATGVSNIMNTQGLTGTTAMADARSSNAAFVLHSANSAHESAIWTNGTGMYVDVAGNATPSSNFIAFRTTNTASSYTPNIEAMRIGSTGNIGIGTQPDPLYRLSVAGDVYVSGNLNATYSQDVAEWVPANEKLAPGTVVVLDPERSNTVVASSRAYDTTVAGVVSARPGLILGPGSDTSAKVATLGRVRVRVDASRHPVQVGDLLVTSDKPGTAMVSEPLDVGGLKIHRPGTLIGKALEPLAAGEGQILTLLSLQ